MVIAAVKTSHVSLDVTTCGLVYSYRRFKDRSLQDQVASLLGLLLSEDEGNTLFRNVCNHSQSTRRNTRNVCNYSRHGVTFETSGTIHS